MSIEAIAAYWAACRILKSAAELDLQGPRLLEFVDSEDGIERLDSLRGEEEKVLYSTSGPPRWRSVACHSVLSAMVEVHDRHTEGVAERALRACAFAARDIAAARNGLLQEGDDAYDQEREKQAFDIEELNRRGKTDARKGPRGRPAFHQMSSKSYAQLQDSCHHEPTRWSSGDGVVCKNCSKYLFDLVYLGPDENGQAMYGQRPASPDRAVL